MTARSSPISRDTKQWSMPTASTPITGPCPGSNRAPSNRRADDPPEKYFLRISKASKPGLLAFLLASEKWHPGNQRYFKRLKPHCESSPGSQYGCQPSPISHPSRAPHDLQSTHAVNCRDGPHLSRQAL